LAKSLRPYLKNKTSVKMGKAWPSLPSKLKALSGREGKGKGKGKGQERDKEKKMQDVTP
jgi:hypothetical protein